MPRLPKINQNRNPYQGIFAGKANELLEHVSEFTPEELVIANFNLIQARVLEILEGGARYSKQAKILMAAMAVLVEQEQISPEYESYVRLLLADITLDRLTSVLVSASNLPMQAVRLREEGSAQVQVKILQQFLIAVLQIAESREVREIGVSTIQRLKLEGGISEEQLQELIDLAEIRTIASSDDEEE